MAGRNDVIIWAKLALAGLLIGILVWTVDVQQVSGILRSVKWHWAVVCLFVAFAIMLYQDMMLSYIARPFARLPRSKLFRFTLISRFFSQFLPSSIGGDLIKGLYLIPFFHTPAYAYASMTVHRAVSGVTTLIMAVVACLLFLPKQLRSPIEIATVVTVIAGCAMVLLIYLFRAGIKGILLKHRDRTKDFILFRFVYSFLGAISSYHQHRRLLVGAFILSLILTQLVAGIYLLLAHSLNLHMTYQQALVASTATSLVALFPITPGSLGVSEGAFVVIARAMGVPAEEALSIIVFGRIVGIVATLPGAILYVRMQKANLEPRRI